MSNVPTILAQVAAENPVLYTYGPMGVMLSYFILRGEKLASMIVRELSDMKETMLLDIVSRPAAPRIVREMAQTKLDALEAKRKSK